MATILIVEDSKDYQQILVKTMGDHKTVVVSRVDEAFVVLRNQSVDLILLDLELPDKDGFSFLAEMQSQNTVVPVICLTGRNDVTAKVTAFSLGAEDYVTKPFDPIELRARATQKLMRFQKLRTQTTTRFEGLEIDHDRHRVTLSDRGQTNEIHLTQTEFKLLACLLKRPDQVYSRDQLLVAAWGEDARVLERVVDVHLSSMRKKLGSYATRIKAVPGAGYKFMASTTVQSSIAVVSV